MDFGVRRRSTVTCATLACGFLLTSPALPQQGATPPTASPQLVIPFENANREPRLYWLTEGSAVLLTDDLRALGVQAMTRDERLRAFEALHVPPVATLSHATVIRLGELVGASQVIVGAFEERQGQLTVRARTIRLDSGRMSAEIVESGPLPQLFAIYARLARRIAPGSKVPFEQMEQGHPPLAAFEQYIKGVLAHAPQTRLSFLAQALKLWPQFPRARLAQWDVYTEQGEHQRALDAVRPVPDSHPLARRARFMAGISLLNLASYQEAYDRFIALNREKTDSAVLNNLGIVQLRRPAGGAGGRPTYFFSEASKLSQDDPDLFFNLGYAYWLDKDVSAAIYWLREAVRRNPADDQAHYVLAIALQASGSTAEAERERALAEQLSSAYTEGDAKQSPGVVPRGWERLKTDIDASGSLGLESVLVASEQRDQRELARFHLDRGRRLFEQERDEEAAAELRRAIYLTPYDSEAHLLLGRVYLRTGRTKDAINALKIAIWSDPANAEARRLLESIQPER